MGCNNSRNIQVKPLFNEQVVKDDKLPEPNATPTKTQQSKRTIARKNKVSVIESPKKSTSGSTGSLGSLRSESSIRGRSATSKISKHSEDSGVLTEYDCDIIDDEYGHVITEYSDRGLIKSIEHDFEDPGNGLDLEISGVGCSRRLSAKDRERQEEQRILASLREEGLIARPKSRATNGLSFEIIMEQNVLPRPPPRLAKLERRKKKKKNMTEEEIKEKLEKAERRRKKAEQERLERISHSTHKSDINSAVESFEQSQKTKEETVKKDLDIHQENREKRFQEMKEKLKAKQEHAEMVRRRKKLVPIVPHPDSELGTELNVDQTSS